MAEQALMMCLTGTDQVAEQALITRLTRHISHCSAGTDHGPEQVLIMRVQALITWLSRL